MPRQASLVRVPRWPTVLVSLAIFAAGYNLATGTAPGAIEALLWGASLAGLVLASSRICSQGFARATCHGSRDRPQVALTFDDGPCPVHTPMVLDALRDRGARATFFVLGTKARQHPKLVARMVAEGHELGCHGNAHRWQDLLFVSAATADLHRALAGLREVTSTAARWYRPPFGIMTPALGHALSQFPLSLAGWSVRTLDTISRKSPSEFAESTLRQVRPGDVVLMHDAHHTSEMSSSPAPAALGDILAGLERRGLRAVTLTELCLPAHSQGDCPPGPTGISAEQV